MTRTAIPSVSDGRPPGRPSARGGGVSKGDPAHSLMEKRRRGWVALAWPGLIFLALVFMLPLGEMVLRSLTDPSPVTYVRLVQSNIYWRSLVTTIWMGGAVTCLTAGLGYLYAYVIRHASPFLSRALLVLVMIPFASSLLVRTYAWTVLLRPNGVINFGLTKLGLQPLVLMHNAAGNIIGMTHILLPYMVLPVYAAMMRTDPTLISAALNLGASRWQAFWKVYVPLTTSGLLGGSMLVFVMSLGFYITPAILGSPRQAMLGQLIATEVNELLRLGTGSALGVVLLVVTLILLWIGRRFIKVEDLWGASK